MIAARRPPTPLPPIRWFRRLIWLLPALAAGVGILVFQGMCAAFCHQQRDGAFSWIEGYASALITACEVSTALVMLGYLSVWLWGRPLPTTRTDVAWVIGLYGVSLCTTWPITTIVTPIAITGDAIFVLDYLIASLIGCVMAVGIGWGVALGVSRVWSLQADHAWQWRRRFGKTWNWGWLVICASGSVIPVVGLYQQWDRVLTIVIWIGMWCTGWWIIGFSSDTWFSNQRLIERHPSNRYEQTSNTE